jgi:uncharacterized membrane protein required for colicin V production
MSWFDIVIIVILAGFLWYGFFFGLIRLIGDLLGLVAGAFVASHTYILVYNFLDRFLPGSPEIGKVVVFVLIFGLASRIVSWLFMLLEQGFNLISIIPFLKSVNRLLGLILGLFEGVLILGIVIYLLEKYLPVSASLATWLSHSTIAPWLITVSKILAPILPQVFNRIQSFV